MEKYIDSEDDNNPSDFNNLISESRRCWIAHPSRENEVELHEIMIEVSENLDEFEDDYNIAKISRTRSLIRRVRQEMVDSSLRLEDDLKFFLWGKVGSLSEKLKLRGYEETR